MTNHMPVLKEVEEYQEEPGEQGFRLYADDPNDVPKDKRQLQIAIYYHRRTEV